MEMEVHYDVMCMMGGSIHRWPLGPSIRCITHNNDPSLLVFGRYDMKELM